VYLFALSPKVFGSGPSGGKALSTFKGNAHDG
jgi:hypothetical protein